MRAIHQRKAGLATDLLSAGEAGPRAKLHLFLSLSFAPPLFALVAHGVPPGYGRGSPRAARARASAPERHGSCFDCGPRAVPRMPPVVTLPNLRAARGCPFASPPRPAARNDPQWGAAGGGAGASGVAALTRGPRAARSLAPLLLQARSRSTASSPSSWASSCSSSSAAGRMQTRSQQVGARAAPPCHAMPRAMSPLTRHDGRAGDRGDRKRPGVRGAGVRDRGHQRRPPQPRDLDGVCRDRTVAMPRPQPVSARALWCLPAGVSAAPARPPRADQAAPPATGWGSNDTRATVRRKCWAPSSALWRSSWRCHQPWMRPRSPPQDRSPSRTLSRFATSAVARCLPPARGCAYTHS